MYQALYRKYRPQSFFDVVGQSAIVKTIKNSLTNEKVSHAYLFYGPRGTGKTTLAKLFAKTINCENIVDGEPCGKCSCCNAFNDKECVDVVEIDAASNNGVDEIRELKNKITLVPSMLKYKVYIVDEVHMLSIGAFNALLKTLEEPPEHVVFILATTEINKVPATILSRCQCFPFKKISEKSIMHRLKHVVEKENINIELKVLEEIAKSCDGGMRDALGMLDQLSSSTNEKITLEAYQNMKGTVSFSEIEEFLKNFYDGNVIKVIKMIQMFDDNGRDLFQIINQVIGYLRDILISYYRCGGNLNYDESKVIESVLKLNCLQTEMKASENTKIILEVGIIKIMKNISREIKSTDCFVPSELVMEKQSEEKQKKEPEKNVDNLETINSEKTKIFSKDNKGNKLIESHKAHDAENKLLEIRINNTFAEASKKRLLDIKEKIPLLKDHIFDVDVGFLVCLLLDANARVASVENVMFSYEYESMVDNARYHEKELKDLLERMLGVQTNLIFVTDEKWNELRKEFIEKKEKNISYFYIKEPAVDLSESDDSSSETLSNDVYDSAVEMFGNIVEVK